MPELDEQTAQVMPKKKNKKEHGGLIKMISDANIRNNVRKEDRDKRTGTFLLSRNSIKVSYSVPVHSQSEIKEGHCSLS